MSDNSGVTEALETIGTVVEEDVTAAVTGVKIEGCLLASDYMS